MNDCERQYVKREVHAKVAESWDELKVMVVIFAFVFGVYFAGHFVWQHWRIVAVWVLLVFFGVYLYCLIAAPIHWWRATVATAKEHCRGRSNAH